MMRSLLCSAPRKDEYEEEFERHGSGSGGLKGSLGGYKTRTSASTSRDFSLGAGIGSTPVKPKRRMSLPLGGSSNTSNGVSNRMRKRGSVAKKSIGNPEGFMHRAHVGRESVGDFGAIAAAAATTASGSPATTGGAPGSDGAGAAAFGAGNLDVEKWKMEIEASMRKQTSPNAQATPGSRPKGPRHSTSISRATPPSPPPASTTINGDGLLPLQRPMSAGSITPATTASISTTTPTRRQSTGGITHNPTPGIGVPRGSLSGVSSSNGQPPQGQPGASSLSRSTSVTGSIPSPPKRKPVPSHLPTTVEVSPPPTLAPQNPSHPKIPFEGEKTIEEKVQQVKADAGEKPEHMDEEKPAPKKEMVPLLGVPEGPIRTAGDGTYYVTKTAKARWDGAMAEVASALRDIDNIR